MFDYMRVSPVPIFNVSEWDEVRVRKGTSYKFNWRTGRIDFHVSVDQR